MNVKLQSPVLSGEVFAPSSKSVLHRALILSAFADAKTTIYANTTSDDILATVDVLKALGAVILFENRRFTVTPIQTLPTAIRADCRSSASTLRFLVPIVATLGIDAEFLMSKELSARQSTAFFSDALGGDVSVKIQDHSLFVTGKRKARDVSIEASLSSQLVSGFLFASALMGEESTLTLLNPPVSSPYIAMTENILTAFGVAVSHNEQTYKIKPSKIHSPEIFEVEGDYSAAAFFLVGGAIGSFPVTVSGLSQNSYQGDFAVIRMLQNFGASVNWQENSVTVSHGNLFACDMDLSDNPDLFPPLAVLAACANGVSHFSGVGRLVYKESNRLESVRAMLATLGIRADYENGIFTVVGGKVTGGTVDSFFDHRIAMSAAILATVSSSPVLIRHAECIQKSYPAFLNDYQKLSKAEGRPCLFLTDCI